MSTGLEPVFRYRRRRCVSSPRVLRPGEGTACAVGDAEVVFLERKLRRPGILPSDATVVALDGLQCLEGDKTDACWGRPLVPSPPVAPAGETGLSRFRTRASPARRSTLDGPARLTLDDDVASRRRGSRDSRRNRAARCSAAPDDSGAQIRATSRRRSSSASSRIHAGAAARPRSYRLGMATLGEAGVPVDGPGARRRLNRRHV